MKKQIKMSIFAALFVAVFMLGVSIDYTSVPNVENQTIEVQQHSGSTLQFGFVSAYADAEEEALPVVAAAEEVPKLPGMDDDPASDLDTATFINALGKSIGSVKGASSLLLVVLISQLLMLFFRTPLGSFAGKWKLLIIYSMSLVGGVIALKLSVDDMGWLAALLHANTLGAFQVLAHQAKKQFWDKKNEKPA